ncbi:MAG TPA: response regulator [Burkholderiaceae bacterium]|nr:response regulator [Burkholderiaceae bacterium]
MRANRKILVVDDDAVVGRSFERVLAGKGYAVITAGDGAEALRKLNEADYDVVFTDIKMPGMSGIEVAERIKSSRPWLPVVIVTGYGTEANEQAARAAGVSDFLRKPLAPEAIEGSTERALHERDAPLAAVKEALASADEALESAKEVLAPPRAAVLAANDAAAVPETAPAAAPETASEAARASGWRAAAVVAKNVGLFFAAPFIGLAYILALPFVGLGVLAWMGVKEMAKNARVARFGRAVAHGAMFVVAPFIGLAYVVLFPFVGLSMLLWMGGRELLKAAAR